ncbi:hypothetical protein FRY97_04270 [Phaeodactylibacter luteus]|uniref:Transglutaminase-like domain-containing protein n=1 Tax=Phaeodactylibacter luteus TaxID=1564516 RepID=A0A5C6S037_9BACT|nr:hypothetical protein FRY97_04270 [Phaeodactylibacter luteus]
MWSEQSLKVKNRAAQLLFVLLLLCSWSNSNAQYRAIDRHARNAPDSLRFDLPALAEWLTATADSETGKARALYTWTSHFLSYDEQASREGRRINNSIRDILKRQRGLCMDYALLFQALAHYAGLHCAVVDGYALPALQPPRALPSAPDHSWNAVWADGQWQLLDATWASADDALQQQFGTDYFFTPPAIFLLSHVPAAPLWQLLPCPLPIEAFSLPIDELLPKAQATAHCLPLSPDSLLRMSKGQRQIYLAREAADFHPTPENKRQLAQALADEAGRIDDAIESTQLEHALAQQDTILTLLSEAKALSPPLLNWQAQLYARTLINQTVGCYQLPEGAVRHISAKEAIKRLENARQFLEDLPEEDLYRRYALPQCKRMIEQLK